MIYTIWALPPVIPVGIQTESGVEEIGFDVSYWLTRWPDMNISVWPTRPGETASYPAADVKLVGNILYWYPNSTDTEKEGAGTVEIVGIGSGKRKSSGVVDTLVKKTSLDVTQETPDPIKPWAEKVLEAAKEAKETFEGAEWAKKVFVVTASRDNNQKWVADCEPKDIETAASKGLVPLLLIGSNGMWYDGNNPHPETGKSVPTFRASAHFSEKHGATQIRSYIAPDKTVVTMGEYVMIPNPYKLSVKQGETTTEYDGSKAVSVEIPDGVDEKAVSKLVEAKLAALLNPVILPETTVTGESGEGKILTPLSANPEAGKTYDVVFNGVTYACPAIRAEDNGIASVVLGNSDMMGIPGGNTDAPFVLILIPGGADMLGDGNLVYGLVVGIDESNTATISVKEATGNDQNKVDNGNITVHANQDGTLAISGIDKSFSEVLAALKNGAHLQLMLTRPDGFTEVYPAVGYADTQIMFVLLPSHDTAWTVEWTESGMTKILSGND